MKAFSDVISYLIWGVVLATTTWFIDYSARKENADVWGIFTLMFVVLLAVAVILFARETARKPTVGEHDLAYPFLRFAGRLVVAQGVYVVAKSTVKENIVNIDVSHNQTLGIAISVIPDPVLSVMFYLAITFMALAVWMLVLILLAQPIAVAILAVWVVVLLSAPSILITLATYYTVAMQDSWVTAGIVIFLIFNLSFAFVRLSLKNGIDPRTRRAIEPWLGVVATAVVAGLLFICGVVVTSASALIKAEINHLSDDVFNIMLFGVVVSITVAILSTVIAFLVHQRRPKRGRDSGQVPGGPKGPLAPVPAIPKSPLPSLSGSVAQKPKKARIERHQVLNLA